MFTGHLRAKDHCRAYISTLNSCAQRLELDEERDCISSIYAKSIMYSTDEDLLRPWFK